MAAVVLLGAVSPPVVRHAHEGGADPGHDHDAMPSQSRQDAGCGGWLPDMTSDDPWIVDEKRLCDSSAHIHVKWWAIRLTLPDSDLGAHDPLPDVALGFGSGLEVSAAIAMPLHVAYAPSDSPASIPASIPAATLSEVFNLASGRLSNDPDSSAIYLCDRARHERSGVQLA